jgi:xylulokinase
VGTGVWKNVPQACKAAIHQTETLKPDRKRAKLYTAHHAQYQRLYAALKGEFKNIASLQASLG